MALPKERVELSTFHGGMAPDLGQVVGGLPETAEELLNVEIQKDGSIRLRPEFDPVRTIDTIPSLVRTIDSEQVGYFSGIGDMIVSRRRINGNLNHFLIRVNALDAASDNIQTQISSMPSLDFDGLNSLTGVSGFNPHLQTQIDLRIPRYTNKFRMIDLGVAPDSLFSHVMVTNAFTNYYILVYDHSTGGWGGPTHGQPAVKLGSDTPVSLYPSNYTGRRLSIGAVMGERVWMAGYDRRPDTVYISRILAGSASGGEAFEFYPATFGTPLPTDGGFITISGAGQIYGLTPFRGGMAVLAEHGIWHITSPGGNIFDATNFTVTQISNTAIMGEDSWVAVEDSLALLTDAGVSVLQLHESGQYITQSLGRGRMDGRFAKISKRHKQSAGLVYDHAQRKLFVTINDDHLAETSDFLGDTLFNWEHARNPDSAFLHNRHLFAYDLDLNSWEQYAIESGTTPNTFVSPWGIRGFLKLPGLLDFEGSENNERTYTIWLMQRPRALELSTIHLNAYTALVRKFAPRDLRGYTPTTGDTQIKARVLSHPLTFDNLSNKKMIHFLHMALGRVESGQVVEGVDLNPGGLRLTVGWDWFKPGASTHPKARQTYNPYRWTETTFGGFDQNKPVIKDKFKLPGRGTAVQLLITNQDADGNYRDFHLKGWQVEVKGSMRR
jgi:hypothetical protein